MSKFSAINLSDDEADLEEHTRELQIEESLKLFKKLLHYQKDKDFDNAFKTYELLFKIDVISDFSPSTHTVSNLRYLSYRNRGFLKFDKLLEDHHQDRQDNDLDENSLDDLYDDLMSCLEDLITSLIFGDGDTNLVELIYQFFQFFGNERLTRFIIEYELMKNDITIGNESNLLVLRRNKISLTFSKFLNRYKQLLSKLEDFDSTLLNEDTFINKNKITIVDLKFDDSSQIRDLSFLKPLKEEILLNQSNNLYVPREIEIDLSKYKPSELNVSTILKEIQHVLPRPKSRLKRFYDHYYSTDDPIEIVNLKLPEDLADVMDVDDADDDVEVILEEIQELEDPADNVDNVDDDVLIVGDSNSNSSRPSVSEESKEPEKQEEKDQERKRSSRRLNSTLVVEEQIKISDLDFTYQEKFLLSIKSHLELLDSAKKDEFNLHELIDTIKGESSSFDDMHLHDLIKILESWNQQKSEMLLLNVENNKKNISIVEILNANSFSDHIPVESKNIDSYNLNNLISSINDSSLHYHQIRIKVLEFILEAKEDECLIVDYKFSDNSFHDLKHFVDCSDILLYTKIKDSLHEKQNLGVAISVFEILVDAYIAIYLELETNKNMEKHKAASIELLNQQRILSSRIERWKALLEDLLFVHKATDSMLFLRFEWCDLTYLQHHENLSRVNEINIKKRLADLLVHKLLSKVEINFFNYQFIKRLSYDNVNVQLSKLNILTTFSNIFKDDSGVDNSEKITLLEKILFPEDNENKSKEQEDMEEFIKSSTLELKLKLFQILLDNFRQNSKMDKYQHSIEHLINVLHSKIVSIEYRKQPVLLRQQELLRIYAFFGEFIDNYVITLSENNWKLADFSNSTEILTKLLEFFRLGYVFCLHEDIALLCSQKISIKSKSTRSHSKLKDIVTNVFSLFFIYYESLLQNKEPGNINNLLDLLHDQLGIRKYCESADGKFLKLLQDTLIGLGWTESENDILQLLSCRYNLRITMDGFMPVDHQTKGTLFDKSNALDVAKYVIPICFKKRNPILNSIKADVKVLLDSIYEAIGDPDETNESVARCTALLDEYLDNTPLDVKVMRNLFYGLESLDLKPARLDMQEAIDNGLYYLQGINSLNIFKVRKRSMQSRISELDYVIKMFKQDLFCGSNRLESWFLLGQTYGFLVEDDLIWTSDKLTNEDKKESTALLQKKSLLCYLMAINQYTNATDKKSLEIISPLIWSSFAKELYNASMEPMAKLCFNVNGIPKYFKRRTKIFEKNINNPISDKTILKVLISAFKMAAKLDDKDWINFYYLAKLEHKIGGDPETICFYLIKSCRLAKNAGSHADPVIEPHYLLCSLIFKLSIKEHISIDDAFEYLSMDPVLKIKKDENIIETKSSFSLVIIDCLKQICAMDKKNWHHKPHYRMARIQMLVFDNVESAKLEMLQLINLKPTVKNLVTIWKPEYERPGKHFTYNLQYVMFFIDILDQDEDLTSLLALGRKLRRFGASIVQLLKAWGHATKKICDLTRKYADIQPNFSELCISTINYGEFMVKAKEFNNYMNGKNGKFDNEQYQDLLYLFTEFAEIKRMSNGFSQTAYIDDTFYCLYLKLYFIYRNEIEENKLPVNVEDAVKSKLAKRDIAEVIKSLNLPKLPEKQVIYKMPQPKIEIQIDDEEDAVSKKIAVPKKTEIVIDGDEHQQPPKTDFGISILSLLKNQKHEEPVLIDDDVKTPEKNKRPISVSDTPVKKLKLEGELEEISDDDVFVTPRKTFANEGNAITDQLQDKEETVMDQVQDELEQPEK